MAIFSGLAAAAAATAGTAGAAGAASASTGLAGVLGTAGTVAGLAGTGMQVVGTIQANKEAERQAMLQKAQMNMEATRQKRQIIRQATLARSSALVNAEAQGASSSSGLAGGLSQIGAEQGSNLAGVNASQDIGNAMFDSNARAAQAATLSSIGSGVSSLGGALVKNQNELARLGVYSTS